MAVTTKPPETLTTSRLVLRPPCPGDIDAIVEGLSDWSVTRNLARVPWPYRRADAEAFLARVERERRNEQVFAIDDGSYCGGISVRDFSGEGPATVGYWLARRVWGRGYATEALTAIVDHAFLGLGAAALAADTAADNTGSMRVLEKAGFRRIGEGTCQTLSRGDLDSVLFRLDRAEWRTP